MFFDEEAFEGVFGLTEVEQPSEGHDEYSTSFETDEEHAAFVVEQIYRERYLNQNENFSCFDDDNSTDQLVRTREYIELVDYWESLIR